MDTQLKTKKRAVRDWFFLCPVRHVIILAGTLLIAAYFLLRPNTALMEAICSAVVRPWHLFCSKLCSLFPFSVAELLIVLGVLGGIAYISVMIVRIVKGRLGRFAGAYRIIALCIAAFAGIYSMFCLLWGVYYYTADFERLSGIEAEPVTAEQLEVVAAYFARQANLYSTRVERDGDGLFAEDRSDILAASAGIYDGVEAILPCLDGNDIAVKPFLLSEIMSYMTFTGFFFPFTGEANVNINSPACLLASTAAHEIAHQRGVAAEDEANFVAVLSGMESGNDVYRYSASLLAYIHLGNALYEADRGKWEAVYGSLNEYVRADLRHNNEYWDKYETPVETVSDAVYTGILHSYGQELGMKSYGACVDLLAAYYYDLAKGE